MWRLPSYKDADCCFQLDCCFGDTKSEPCWGQTTVVDEICAEEDSSWVHACEGHAEWCGPYEVSTLEEDKGEEPKDDGK